MAPASRVHDPRACEKCGRDLPPKSSVNRRFCERCGHARRAITFLRQADEHVGQITGRDPAGLAGAVAARTHIHQALEELGA
jgi:hypothetical protein